MKLISALKRNGRELLSAIQFLTRVPLPSPAYQEDSLASAVKYFPVVGALIGGVAALLHVVVVRHLARAPAALVIVIFLVLITGCLHEDGLADAADGFGGGHGREKILIILRDSRIGSYGATAICLSLVARIVLISSMPLTHVAEYLIAANVLGRWTVLPLSYFLPSARQGEGQGARVAKHTTRGSLIFGTVVSLTLVGLLLRGQAVAPIAVALLTTLLSARFYLRKIGGVTGDCFGATIQLSEVIVYFCGAWIV